MIEGSESMVYVLSDLHGCDQQWKKMLSLLSPQASDELFVLGDLLDRGAEPIKLLFDIMARENVFCLLGNHEYFFLQCVAKLPLECDINNFMLHCEEQDLLNLAAWMQNGGRTTLEQYLALSPDDKEAVLDYLLDLPLYEELLLGGRHYVLTHSGLRNFNPGRSLTDYAAQDFLFDRPGPQSCYFEDRTLVCGHTPTFYYPGHPPGEIFKGRTFINLDCGCVYPEQGGRLGCLCLDDYRCFYLSIGPECVGKHQ